MPAAIVHLTDDDTTTESYQLIRHLIEQTQREFDHTVVHVGRRTHKRAERWLGAPPVRCPLYVSWPTPWAPGLTRLLRTRNAGVVHAWGIAATQAAGALADEIPLITTALAMRTDPLARWVRSASDKAPRAVVCTSQLLCRRCLQAGLSPEHCVVIRPGVDFAELAAAGRSIRPADLALPDDAPLLLTLPITDRTGGHEQAIWAAAILQQIWPEIRLIVPGAGRARRRLMHLAEAIDRAWMVLWPGERWSWAQLLAVSDALVVSAAGDFDTAPIGWAMAGSVGIIGAATPALVEFVAAERNGLLCQRGRHVDLARKVRQFLTDRELRLRLVEAACAQAYEVFSLRACIENHARLWDNLLSGRAPADDIRDAAMAG
jgi:glycosyltransferase involved in cell wall biosynthesis